MKSVIQQWLWTILLVCTIRIHSSASEGSSILDVSSFLDPSVIPSYFSSKETRQRDDNNEIKSNSATSLHSSSPSENSEDAMETLRQLSLAPTTAFIQRKLFNSSVAFTIPLFLFTLPQRATQGSSVDLANQAVFGLFAVLLTMMTVAVPVLFTGLRPPTITGRSNDQGTQGIINNLMPSSPVFNLFGEDLKHKIGLDPTKCLQKTICEAHRIPQNKYYGLLALPFQIFFPPPSNSTSDARASTLQLAARDGKYSNKECGQEFNCFFDILDLATYIVDWYRYSNDQDNYNDLQNLTK